MFASAVYRLLDMCGAAAAWRVLRRADIVLCYHNVLPAGAAPDGDGSLHLARDRFEEQLDWLTRRFEIVPLAAVAANAAIRDRRPRCAISFDDAYQGVLENALPALRARGLPATIFVCSAASTSEATFWWDRVAHLRPGLDRVALRDHWAGRGQAILDHLGLSGADDSLPPCYRPASWQSLRQVVGNDVTLGAHTHTHPMLTMLDEPELRTELSAPIRLIREQTGCMVSAIAYPYGDVNARVASIAAESGYRIGVTTSGSPVRGPVEQLLVPRVNIPSSMGRSTFAVATSGLRFRR